MRRARCIAFVLLAALPLTGCAFRMQDFTFVSTRPVRPEGVDLDALPRRHVRGEAALWWFLCIPFGGPRLVSDAVEATLKEHNADALLDAEVYFNGWTTLLISRTSYSVEGDAVNLPRGGPQ